MRSWVFRNRVRLEELLGRRSPSAAGAHPASAGRRAGSERQLVLVPVRRPRAGSP